MKEKLIELEKIYSSFSEKAKGYKAGQACQKGCAFCCAKAGSIDITTLEGLRIRKALNVLAKKQQKSFAKTLHQEMKKREKEKIVPCPFLMKSKACIIYNVRPFSCRRIYSNHICTSQKPPEVNRHVMDIAGKSIKALQQLDDTGYSGHLSYILHMLDTPAFLDTYLNGDFKPREIMVFGKSHKIIINKMML
ncbi:MAG: YkgJ family cysteine cluster protein [Desulfobacula sp.]|uniref:YkgJ family cysteine cluster protein n=1 Tax=Desulfobacula sp. TaxID=2593537 RepID=UPI0025C3E383|nr:YkgJ family cysteine cluster protein [Desulfobacula sp.]MCD4721269.1 YkgJ family cysteine cluster protein [Desulfobacula sp.]